MSLLLCTFRFPVLYVYFLHPSFLGAQVKFGPGEEVIKEGETGDCMFIVYDGEVSIYKTVEGTVTELAKCKRGDFFGERALLKDEPRAASIKVKKLL